MKLLVENPGFILFAVKKKLILQVINRLFMKADINVPIPVLRRMPSYLSFVKTLQKQGEKYVSSTRIDEYMEIDSTQVTKDLSHTGISGKTRVGYEVDSFVRILKIFWVLAGWTEHFWSEPVRWGALCCKIKDCLLSGYR